MLQRQCVFVSFHLGVCLDVFFGVVVCNVIVEFLLCFWSLLSNCLILSPTFRTNLNGGLFWHSPQSPTWKGPSSERLQEIVAPSTPPEGLLIGFSKRTLLSNQSRSHWGQQPLGPPLTRHLT